VADSRTGELTLTTTTAEDDGSPARFVAEMDGGAQRRRLNGDDQTSTDGLPPLDHTLLLTSVPEECIVNSENPTTITVSQDLRAAGAFATTCSTATGEVEVTISSNASFSGDLDSNGYKLLINGGAQRIDVPISGTRTVALSVDDTTSDRSREHELTLTDIAPNCVTTDNPRTVTVEQGASEPTTFTVNCFDRAQDTGTLQIQTSTTGEDPDGNGYLLRIDGGAQISSARADGSVRLSGYAAGQHEIEITEVASNCRSSPTSQTVNVAAGSDSATATFEVECDPVDNTLEVRAATAGSTNKLNPNDYGLALDGIRRGNVTLEINGDQVILPNVSSGEHTVELLDLVDPCFVTNGSQGNDNPVITTEVPANGRGFVTFAVNCDEDDRPDS
jgi:hypothetical protein